MNQAEKRSNSPIIGLALLAGVVTVTAVLIFLPRAKSDQGREAPTSQPSMTVVGSTWVFSDSNFERDVLKSPQPVLVDFGASWCGPCRAQSPIIDELRSEFAGKVRVGKIDVDNNRRTAGQFGVSALPTMLLFDHGKVTQKIVGLTSKESLRSVLRSAAK